MTTRKRIERLESHAAQYARLPDPSRTVPLAERISDCVAARVEGHLPPDGYLLNMTPAEQAQADGSWGALLAFADDLENAGLELSRGDE